MFSASWNRPSYSKVASRAGQGGDGGLGGGGGGDVVQDSRGNAVDTRNAINADSLVLLRNDRRGQQATAKFLFQERIKMEEKRRLLAKGNIVTFLFETSVPDRKSHMSVVLRTAGFKSTDVKGIKLNEFRTNQAEILFDKEVSINVDQIEKKLQGSNLNVRVAKFDDTEETFMIYGLPLSDDTGALDAAIRDAIRPFVKEIKEVVATKHVSDKEDFFDGHLDGNFKVKVVPFKNGTYVPNFIVVGKDVKACGKVVYTKSLSPKKQMCLNCYSLDHIKTDPICNGPVKWEVYVTRFESYWKEAQAAKHGGEKDGAENLEDGVEVSDETRVAMYLREASEMEGLKQQVESLNKDLEAQLEIVSRLENKIAGGESEDEDGMETSDSTLNKSSEAGLSDTDFEEDAPPEDDPLSSSLIADENVEDERNSKRPSSSPAQQERSSKQVNSEIDIGKTYTFTMVDKPEITGKVKSKTGQIVIATLSSGNKDVEVDLATCKDYYLENV